MTYDLESSSVGLVAICGLCGACVIHADPNGTWVQDALDEHDDEHRAAGDLPVELGEG